MAGSRHRQRGFVLALLLVVLSAISVLVLVAASWRSGRLRQAWTAYADAAALSLAQGGVEAAAASLARGQEPEERPLGQGRALSQARGELVVRTSGDGELVEVESCAMVTPSRLRIRPVQRCVKAALRREQARVKVLRWREE